MKVASIQLEIKDQPKASTLEHVLTLLETLAGNDLILLPELWPIGYFAFEKYESEAEFLNGPTVQALQKMAAQLRAHIFMGSFIERDGDHLFNTGLFLDPAGKIIGRYRKIHLFGYQSAEAQLLQRGDEVIVVETPLGRAGLATCYDLRFPEFFRKMLDQGAEFFLVTSAWPAIRGSAWRLFNRARAHENLAYLFSCNCAGTSGGKQFAGHSLLVNPGGEIIAEAGEGEQVISAEVDMAMVEVMRNDFSVLQDRVFR